MKSRKIVALIIGVFSTVIFSCKKEPAEIDLGTASVRLVNTVRTSNPQDLHQQNTKLTKSTIAYGSFSDYLNAVGGASVIWTNDAIQSKATAATDAILYDKSTYTLFYYEIADDKGRIAGYINDNKAPAAGKFKVRFLNIATSFENRPLIIADQSGAAISQELNFGANPVYIERSSASEIKINVKDQAVFTTIPASTFQEGKIYLVWFDTTDGITVQYHIVPQE